MASTTSRVRRSPTDLVFLLLPPVALLVLVFTFTAYDLPVLVQVLVGALLAGSVLVAVHHAEVVAHRVGEPYGSLILAVAVTVIEVGLIVMLMIGGGEGTATLARDTVFAAVMITCNGILGLSLLLATLRKRVAVFQREGTAAALGTVLAIATLCLVLPTFTTTTPGPQFSPSQLAFAAIASLALYLLFVFVQSIRHRDYFVATEDNDADRDDRADGPTNRATLVSLGLLLASLVAVVGLAKVEQPAIQGGVDAAGLPPSFVGVVIALLVLLPETIAAARNARRGRLQIGLNLALGSAMASIGLTIPVIAVASIWLPGPLTLGLDSLEIVLLALTAAVGVLTVIPGRATILQAGLHLVLCATFLWFAAVP